MKIACVVGTRPNFMKIAPLLTEYIYEPRLTVSIDEFHSHRILISGPFQKPGKYELRSDYAAAGHHTGCRRHA